VAAAVLAVLAVGCGSGRDENPPDEQLQSVVDGLTQDVFVGNGLTGQRQLFHLPGAALTVDTTDGGARTFVSGLANVADGTPVSADLVQPVGSNTKVVTAVLVMQLVEQGRFDVDDKLVDVESRYRRDGGALARLVSRYRGRLRDVELRELLDHTSGLADCLDSPAFFRAFERRPRANYRLDQLAG
jgi:CubicO group peptidase (beta-lactamase class C family)